VVVGPGDEGFVKSIVTMLPSKTNEISEIIDQGREVKRLILHFASTRFFDIVAIPSAICNNNQLRVVAQFEYTHPISSFSDARER
jgi:hypothetical protein